MIRMRLWSCCNDFFFVVSPEAMQNHFFIYVVGCIWSVAYVIYWFVAGVAVIGVIVVI